MKEQYIEIGKQLREKRLDRIGDDDLKSIDHNIRDHVDVIESGVWGMVSVETFLKYLDLIGVDLDLK